jgi:crotonobetainyl-CoA:carnitine CoA-transferase CaiB-like acyl-CoA transferase
VYYGALVAPMLGATAALAALSWSRRTGQPAFLDIAQADAAAFANLTIEEHAASPSLPPTGAPAADGRSTMQAYRTLDGKVLLVMALERKFLVRLADAVGRPDLLDGVDEDEHLARGNVRIDETLVEILASRDLDDWMQLFAAADVPAIPVNDSAGAFDDPHLRERLEWLDADDGTSTMKTPVRGVPSIAAPDRAPAIGADTAEVLAAIGVESAELERLARAGDIRLGS